MVCYNELFVNCQKEVHTEHPRMGHLIFSGDSGLILTFCHGSLVLVRVRKKGSFVQRFRKGVGGRGLATNRAQNVVQNSSPELCHPSSSGHRKKGTEKTSESLASEESLGANPLCPPTPFRNFRLWKGVFSEKSKISRDSRDSLEILEILENPQTVENTGESGPFSVEIL